MEVWLSIRRCRTRRRSDGQPRRLPPTSGCASRRSARTGCGGRCQSQIWPLAARMCGAPRRSSIGGQAAAARRASDGRLCPDRRGVFTAEIVAARQRHALEAGGEGCHERCWAAVKRHRLLHHRGPNHPVPLEYSIEWLTCAFASRSDVALVSLPGAAQDRLLAHMPYAVDSPYRLTRWASSSRSQRARRTAGAAACLAWEALSASVRCRPPLSVVIVTHLVARSIASRCRERLLIRKLVSYWRVAAPGEPGSESGAQAAGLRITV